MTEKISMPISKLLRFASTSTDPNVKKALDRLAFVVSLSASKVEQEETLGTPDTMYEALLMVPQSRLRGTESDQFDHFFEPLRLGWRADEICVKYGEGGEWTWVTNCIKDRHGAPQPPKIYLR